MTQTSCQHEMDTLETTTANFVALGEVNLAWDFHCITLHPAYAGTTK